MPPRKLTQYQVRAAPPFGVQPGPGYHWFYPWSLPTLPKRNPRAAIALIPWGEGGPPIVPTLFVLKEYPEFATPVRFPKGLAPHLQQSVASIPFIEPTFYSKFSYPWSEPVRFLPGLRSCDQQVIAFLNPSPFQTPPHNQGYIIT